MRDRISYLLWNSTLRHVAAAFTRCGGRGVGNDGAAVVDGEAEFEGEFIGLRMEGDDNEEEDGTVEDADSVIDDDDDEEEEDDDVFDEEDDVGESK